MIFYIEKDILKLNIDNSLKNFILATKSIDDIIIDFQTQFPQFATYSDDLLKIYINITFFILPIWIINVGFDTTYLMYLYALAHILISQDVNSDGTTSSDDDRLSQSNNADGVSITYKNLSQSTEISEWEYFYGNTNYGKMVLLFLKANGLGTSKGVFVV